ncbi:hypothetical protein [Nocardia sp. NPDC052316]
MFPVDHGWPERLRRQARRHRRRLLVTDELVPPSASGEAVING